MKKILKYSFILTLLFLFIPKIYANSIESINMDIYVDKSGNAHVTETWTATLNSGTEGYHPYFNLGNATITDYRVKDESRDYQTISDWNIHSSFQDKAYKAGLYYTGSEIDLCWGISNYGRHTYTLSYIINGFVAETEDAQMIYWTLIPRELSSKPNQVYIKIYADERFSDDLDVWGYGNYGGYAYVYDGYIELLKENLNSNEYMTVLVKFDKGTFATSNKVESGFNHYYTMAEEGTTHYKETKTKVSIYDIFMAFFGFLFLFGIFRSIIKSANKSGISGTYHLDFGEIGKSLPKDVNMFRNIPCNKDIYRAYWTAYNYGLMNKQTDFLGTIFLKWLTERKIKIESKTVGKIFKKEDTVILLDPNNTFDIELENILYGYLYEASKDGILESKEFERWCSNHYSKILKWFDKVLDYESDKLVKEGKMVRTEKTTLKIFKSVVYEVSIAMREEAIQMKGLKIFFKEFENMKDKEAIEVMLWKEYLMYAQIFGEAKKVAKQFKELYPDVITDVTYDSFIFINTFSYSGVSAATTARSRAESYSSGGGGFSSGGGGGGSFGGGGGGGGFR